MAAGPLRLYVAMTMENFAAPRMNVPMMTCAAPDQSRELMMTLPLNVTLVEPEIRRLAVGPRIEATVGELA